ncbi:MAG TPA: PilZ domain-containing protein [Candidatus Omnitrophota bacterium]|nr:PilZ domain-containing protein [Candidatus Omnitrophota bacterium]HPD84944.1 PilZ domain-containing protein [Candidatus Omnitrophota bacterium]HRZ03802.1 PilZ domain-containing protein [Candidatus Omnitrophota bacterium]
MAIAALSGLKPAVRCEKRQSLRIKESLPISWHIKDQGISGSGKIRNISDSGMLLESRTDATLSDNGVLTFESALSSPCDFLPSLGRIVWSRRNGSRLLCGIAFIEPAQDVLVKLREKVQSTIIKLEGIEKMKSIFGIILIVVMVAVTSFILIQQTVIRENYEKSSNLLSAAFTTQAGLYTKVSKDLTETRTVLAQTQTILEEAQKQNALLQDEVTALNTRQQVLDNQIVLLQDENTKLSQELGRLKDRLKPFENEAANLDEGKSFNKIVRKRLREIKINMSSLKRKAHEAMVAAQKERDRIALEQGNRGYLVKDSQIVNSSAAPIQPQKKFKIDVSLVE